MRRVFGAIFFLVGAYCLYQFATWGALLAPAELKGLGREVPFHALGHNYPWDAVMLAAAAWGLGLGLYFIVSSGAGGGGGVPSHVPASSRWAQRMATQQAEGSWSPMASTFLLNALLLITALFAAYVGTRAPGDHGRHVAIFALVAGLHTAVGLILLVLSLFEKPKGAIALVLGGAVYASGTAVAVLVFLWGQPTQP